MKNLVIVFTVILLFLTVGCNKQNILQKESDPSIPLTLKSASLGGTVTNSSAAVDLTAEGTSDWTHYWSTFDRKSGGSSISNYTKVGTGTVYYYTDDTRPMSWTGGTPTASSTNNKNGIYINGTNNGSL